jgi:hypothetical protein
MIMPMSRNPSPRIVRVGLTLVTRAVGLTAGLGVAMFIMAALMSTQ